MQLFRPETNGQVMGCSQISFNNVENSYLIYGTSDEGELFCVDWDKKGGDEAGAKQDIFMKYFTAERNCRPTIAFDTSPFYSDLVMTVHDCHFCIWKLECQEPVFVSPFITSGAERTYITCGFFSPSRPGVVYIGRADGYIDVWDFMDQSNNPTQSHFVVAAGISSMEVNPVEKDSEHLAVGDVDGCLHLLKLPLNLRRRTPNELENIRGFFDKEMERVNYFNKRFEYRHELKVAEEAAKRTGEDEEYMIFRRADVVQKLPRMTPRRVKTRS